MNSNRRQFLKSSTALAAASTVALPAVAKSAQSPNDRFRVSVIGMRRGLAHALSLARMGKNGENVEIVSVCDCDTRTAEIAAKRIESEYGKRPAVVQDLREVMADKSIDGISIGTPDHWHALAAIWACQAGKDVFVEKPLAHTVEECRKMVQAARKYNRMVQVGTQCRSSPNIIEGVKKAQEGAIGRIYMARALSYKVHGNLGRHEPTEPPAELDWNLFVGAAREQEFSNFRYRRWYWLKDFCNGDMANQPVHQLDIIRWAMQLHKHPVKVQSMGMREVHEDDREWPDNQTFACQFDDGRMVTVEHRNWWTPAEAGFRDPYQFHGNPDACVGAFLLGTEGFMIFPDYTSYYTFLGPKRELGPHAAMPNTAQRWHVMDYVHHPNWLKACRSRNREDLNADILEGHMACTMPLLGNISYLTGRTIDFDPETETIKNDDEANRYLRKSYREPFVVPQEV